MTVFGLAPKDPSMSTAAMGLVEALGAALVRDVEAYARLIQERQFWPSGRPFQGDQKDPVQLMCGSALAPQQDGH